MNTLLSKEPNWRRSLRALHVKRLLCFVRLCYLPFLAWVVPGLIFIGLFEIENHYNYDNLQRWFGFGPVQITTQDTVLPRVPRSTVVSLSSIYPSSKTFVQSDGLRTNLREEFKHIMQSDGATVTTLSENAQTESYLLEAEEENYLSSTPTFILGGTFFNER